MNLGETAQITCFGLSSGYAVGWHQQKVPGSAPVPVICRSTSRSSDISSGFSRSGTMATLTITGVQAKDKALYYCGGRDSSSYDPMVTESSGELVQKHPTITGTS